MRNAAVQKHGLFNIIIIIMILTKNQNNLATGEIAPRLYSPGGSVNLTVSLSLQLFVLAGVRPPSSI